MSLFNELNDFVQSSGSQNGVQGNIRSGVTLAEVTSIQDPDSLGRVRCHVKSAKENIGDLGWAFVAAPYAGKDCGLFALPNVGDLVLVAFECGDVRRPFVVGSIWGGAQQAPVKVQEGKNEQLMLKTPGKNQITVSDIKNSESITIETPAGHCFKLSDQNSTLSLSDKDGKNAVSIQSKSGEIQLKCVSKLTLKAGENASIVIDGNTGSIKITAGQQLSLEGVQMNLQAKGTASIKASAQLSAESDGIVIVKGGMVKLN